MKKFTESIWFQYLAVALSILLVFNLIPPTAFRTSADTNPYATIKLFYEMGGTSYLPEVNGTVTLTDSSDSNNKLYGTIENGVATVEDIEWAMPYDITVTLNGTDDYILVPNTNVFIQNMALMDDVSFTSETNIANVKMITSGTTSVHGFISGGMPEDTAQVQVTAINGHTLNSPITATASGTDNEFTLADVPNVPYGVMKISYSCEGYETVTNDVQIPAVGEDLETVTMSVATYRISATCGANGKVAFDGDDTINPYIVTYNADVSVTVTADDDYLIEAVSVDGQPQQLTDRKNLTFSLTGVKSDHTITASFIALSNTEYQVSFTSGMNGSITYDSHTITSSMGIESYTVLYQTEVSYTVTPDEGYYVFNVEIDGNAKTLADEQKGGFTDSFYVTADTRVIASFAEKTDTTAPVISDVNPSSLNEQDYRADGYGSPEARNYKFSVNDVAPSSAAEKKSGVSTLYVAVGSFSGIADMTAPITLDVTDGQTVSVEVTSGSTYTFILLDKAGNESDPRVITFIQDTEPPVLVEAALYSDAACTSNVGIVLTDSGYSSADTIYLKVKATDNYSGVAMAGVFDSSDSQLIDYGAQVQGSDGTFIFTLKKENFSDYRGVFIGFRDKYNNMSDKLQLTGTGLLESDKFAIGEGKVASTFSYAGTGTSVNNLYGDAKFRVELTDSHAAGITNVSITVNGTPVTVDASGTAISASETYISGISFLLDESLGADLFKEGSNVITVSAQNIHGGKFDNGQTQVEYTFALDTTAPEITNIALYSKSIKPKIYGDGALYSAQEDIVFTVTASDGANGSGIGSIFVYDGDTLVGTFNGNYSEASEDDYPRFTLPNSNYGSLNNLEIDLSVVVTDKLGNTSAKIVPNDSFSLKSGKIYYSDNTTVTVTIAAEDATNTQNWFATVPDVKISVEDVFSGISEYEICQDGNTLLKGNFDDIAAQTNSYEFTIPGEDINLNGATDFKISIWFNDRVGVNHFEINTFHLDAQAPEITAFEITPVSGTTLSSYSFGNFISDAVTVEVSASDLPAAGVGLSSISLYANQTLIGTKEVADGEQSVTFDLTKDILASLGTGAITLKAYAVDKLGNQSVETVMTTANSNLSVANIFYYDGTGSITTAYDTTNSFVDGQKVWVPLDTDYSVDVENTVSGIKSVEILCNGVPVTVDKDGNAIPSPISTTEFTKDYSLNFNLSTMGTADSTDGSVNIVIHATDFAGNVTTKEETLYVDDGNPSITGYEITPVDTVNTLNFLKFGTFTNGKVKVTISVSDNGISSGLRSVALTVDANNPLLAAVVDGKAVFELPESAVADDTAIQMILSATVTDNVGNKSNAAGPTDMTPAGNSDILVVEKINPLITVTKDSGTEQPRVMGEGTAVKNWYSGDVIWNITFSDTDSGIGSYEITLNGTKLTADADAKAISGDNSLSDDMITSESFRISSAQVSMNSDCSYTLNVKAKDNSGNEAAIYTETIYRDNKSPEITGFTVAKKDASTTFLNTDYGVYANGPITVTVEADDSNPTVTDPVSGVVGISLYVNGTLLATGNITDGSGRYTFTVPADVLPTDSSTAIVLKAEATDASGLTGTGVNLSTSNSNLLSDRIILENVKPQIAVTIPDAGKSVIDGKIWYTDDFDIAVKVTDIHSAIDTVKVLVNGNEIKTTHDGTAIPTSYKNPNGAQTTSLDFGFNTEDFPSSDSTYQLHITVTDQAGNVNEYEGTYYIDRIDPKVDGYTIALVNTDDVLNYRAYGTYSNGQIVVTVSVSDETLSSGCDRITLTINGKDYAASVVDGKATFLIPDSAVAAGSVATYKMTATVSDKCGRISLPVALDHASFGTMQNDSVMIEKKQPTITGSAAGQNLYSNNGKNWYSSDVDWTIRIADADSGIASIKVTINGTEITTVKDGSALKKDFTSDSKVTLENEFVISTAAAKSAADGSYQIVVTVIDNAGNESVAYTDMVYKDTSIPQISKFRFSTDGFVEGSEEEAGVTITDYGFYFTKDATVFISATDAEPSSKVKSITYYLHDLVTGDTTPVTQSVDANGEISVTIKSPFKGQIYAKATDNVNNSCGYVTPKSAIVENDDNHDAETHIIISKPETKYRQANGVELYQTDVNFGITVVDRYSGIRSIEWSVEAPYDRAKNTSGVLSIGNDGTLSGDTGWTKSNTDSNLVTEITKTIPITHDSNDIVINVKMIDRAGNETSDTFTIGIDKTAPTIEYAFDVNTGDPDNPNYYAEPRVMTIVVTERNFVGGDFIATIKNTDGKVPVISAWVDNNDTQNPNRTTHTATISFRDDGHYSATLNYTDRAGNAAMSPAVQSFVIDQTDPVISVTYDNNDVHNGMYYNQVRNATVTITERNFDVSRVNIGGNATSVGNWSANGDRHSVVVSFTNDSRFEMSVSATDRAGNVATPYTEEPFIVDLTAPEIKVSGFEEANKKEVAPVISITDRNFNAEKISVSIKANDGQEITNEYTTEELETLNYTGIMYSYRNFDTLPENDGIYTLTVTATDLAGNSSTPVVKKFSVNRYGSTYDLSRLQTINGQYLKAAPDIVFEEINIDEIDLNQVEVNVVRNGVPTKLVLNQDFTIEAFSEDGKNYVVYLYTIKKSAFDKDGEYVINVSSVDKAGNINQNYEQNRNGKINFCIDNIAPNVLVLEPVEGGTYAQTSLEATVEVKDNYYLKDVRIFLDDEEVSYAQNGNRYTFTLQESDTVRSIRVVALDGAGNENVIEVKDILVSTNMFARFLNNTGAVVGTSAGVLGVLGAIIIILLRKRKKNA